MAKKRKAPAGSAARDSAPDDSNKRTRMRIDTYEDVAGSDDEFHINRDKVLLDDGPEAKRRRKYQDQGTKVCLMIITFSDTNLIFRRVP